MKNWISFHAEFGNFQHRNTIYIFALKMSFLAVIFSAVVIILTLPPLGYFGILPINLVHAIIFGVILSWLIGGVVSGVLPDRRLCSASTHPVARGVRAA
jgi:hypothetical protein